MTPAYINTSKATWTAIVERLKGIFLQWGVDPENYHIEHDPEVTRSSLSRESWGSSGWARVRYRAPGTDAMVEMRLDSQATPARNLGAIAMTIEAIRMQDRRSLSGLVAAHHLALGAGITTRDPYELLGVRPDAPMEVIEASHRALSRRAHPDTGGSNEEQTVLNEALEELKWRAGTLSNGRPGD